MIMHALPAGRLQARIVKPLQCKSITSLQVGSAETGLSKPNEYDMATCISIIVETEDISEDADDQRPTRREIRFIAL